MGHNLCPDNATKVQNSSSDPDCFVALAEPFTGRPNCVGHYQPSSQAHEGVTFVI